MRRHGTIRPLDARAAACVVVIGLAMWGGAGATETAPPTGAQSTAWLPIPSEEVEAPDRLAEPSLRGDAAIEGVVSGGRWTSTRLVARARTGSWAVTAARIDARSTRPRAARGTILASCLDDRIRIAAGRIAIRDAPVLFGEEAGFSRRLRRPLEPRSRAPEWEAPRSAGGLGIDGVSLAIESTRMPNRAAWVAWALGGRAPNEHESMRAAGIAHRTAAWEASASAAPRFGSFAGRWRGRAATVALEALASRGRGPALLASATALAGSPLRVDARWRRRPDERRPVATEFSAEAQAGRAGTARLTWRPWSASGSAFADDGAMEVDARWRPSGAPDAVRIRLGRRGGEWTAADRAYAGVTEGAAIPERYVLLDLPLAGERGRLVSLLASRRERGGGDARAIGTTLGARARLGLRGRASVTAQVDAARTHGRAAPGSGAWSSVIAASGEETLTARGSGGIYVTVSGWVRTGPVAVRMHARDGEDGHGGRPLQATVWVEWSGSAKGSRPTGDAGSGG